jgi:hypothetical protein
VSRVERSYRDKTRRFVSVPRKRKVLVPLVPFRRLRGRFLGGGEREGRVASKKRLWIRVTATSPRHLTGDRRMSDTETDSREAVAKYIAEEVTARAASSGDITPDGSWVDVRSVSSAKSSDGSPETTLNLPPKRRVTLNMGTDIAIARRHRTRIGDSWVPAGRTHHHPPSPRHGTS